MASHCRLWADMGHLTAGLSPADHIKQPLGWKMTNTLNWNLGPRSALQLLMPRCWCHFIEISDLGQPCSYRFPGVICTKHLLLQDWLFKFNIIKIACKSGFLNLILLKLHANLGCFYHIDGLVQDCSISIALAMEIMQSCTKPMICN